MVNISLTCKGNLSKREISRRSETSAKSGESSTTASAVAAMEINLPNFRIAVLGGTTSHERKGKHTTQRKRSCVLSTFRKILLKFGTNLRPNLVPSGADQAELLRVQTGSHEKSVGLNTERL